MSRIAYLTLTLTMFLAGDAPAAEHLITQKNTAFSAAEIKIKRGDAIVFKNEDIVPHNVFTAAKANQFNSNVQQPGESVTIPFKQEGTAELRCVMHPTMKLMVEVKK